MLRNVTRLKGFEIRARDGEFGILDQFYFDDENWAIRYLVVNSGNMVKWSACTGLAHCPPPGGVGIKAARRGADEETDRKQSRNRHA